MKLLIVTQKVNKNDQILGFFHAWIVKFAEHFDLVTVICLEEGEHELPMNVKVLSLGKEKRELRSNYIHKFYSYIWNERKNYDVVFVHMNPIYVVLGGFIWKMLGKGITLWYTHRSVDWKLVVTEKLVDKIFTASKESFRLVSGKVMVTGHGIDTDEFSPKREFSGSKNAILSVGRISETKGQREMIEAIEILHNRGSNFSLQIIGDAVTSADFTYKKDLEECVAKRNLNSVVIFKGKVDPDVISEIYPTGEIFINLSNTGSLDKAVLEAMSSGLKILTSNEAFRDILSKENLTTRDSDEIAQKIEILSRVSVNPSLRDIVVKNHSLVSLIMKLSAELKGLK